jgi:hypothetical protein
VHRVRADIHGSGGKPLKSRGGARIAGVDPLGGAGVHYWGAIGERYQLALTVVSTSLIDRPARKLGRPLLEAPVGFNLCALREACQRSNLLEAPLPARGIPGSRNGSNLGVPLASNEIRTRRHANVDSTDRAVAGVPARWRWLGLLALAQVARCASIWAGKFCSRR